MADNSAPEAGVAAEFRAAMRRLASTVCVVTAAQDGHWVGMTMTAVTSMSMEPPSLLISAHRASRLCGALAPGVRFCVNVLRVGHDETAEAFAGRLAHEERFAGGQWRCEGGPPWLADALCGVVCETAASLDFGSHTIFVGRVEAVRLNSDGPPLIYGQGRYGGF
ncbi:MAG TPA: flavin reductase family protein [Caulobacteraceae bacterium]|jgi:flavin reductase (DIM6/NTAB) family NADH-FMN oxidoreductase RutF